MALKAVLCIALTMICLGDSAHASFAYSGKSKFAEFKANVLEIVKKLKTDVPDVQFERNPKNPGSISGQLSEFFANENTRGAEWTLTVDAEFLSKSSPLHIRVMTARIVCGYKHVKFGNVKELNSEGEFLLNQCIYWGVGSEPFLKKLRSRIRDNAQSVDPELLTMSDGEFNNLLFKLYGPIKE